MPRPKRRPITLGGARREPEADPLASGMSPSPTAAGPAEVAAAAPAKRARKAAAKTPARAATPPGKKTPTKRTPTKRAGKAAPAATKKAGGGGGTARSAQSIRGVTSPPGPDHAGAHAAHAEQATGRPKTEARTTYWTPEVYDRVRAAAMFLNAYKGEAGVRSTRDVIEPAVISYVDYLERQYNNGEPFPGVRLGGLPQGRPRR